METKEVEWWEGKLTCAILSTFWRYPPKIHGYEPKSGTPLLLVKTWNPNSTLNLHLSCSISCQLHDIPGQTTMNPQTKCRAFSRDSLKFLNRHWETFPNNKRLNRRQKWAQQYYVLYKCQFVYGKKHLEPFIPWSKPITKIKTKEYIKNDPSVMIVI